VEFYIRELEDGWQANREDIGVVAPIPPLATPSPTSGGAGSISQARLVRGTAVVFVSTEGMYVFPGQTPLTNNTFTVTIDAEGTVERPYCD
jgi:hypothetical protein